MSKILYVLIFLNLLHASSYESGKALYKKNGCGSCHGAQLEGMHKYPYLANRSKGYMTYKLKRFRSQLSDNQQQEMMIPFAENLSDKDIDNLTSFMNDFKPEKQRAKYNDKFSTSGDGGS